MLTIRVRVRYDPGMLRSARSERLDAVFDALANASRREIVARLVRGPLTTPEIGVHFDFSKQALNRHVELLEAAGIVTRKSRGRVHELRLVPGPLDGVTRWIGELRRGWAASLDRLDEVLNEPT